MPGKILGLDINNNSIAAVRVTSSLKGFQVTACSYVAFENDDGLENALKIMFEQDGLKSDICHSSIPGEYASFRNLQLPFKDTKKIKQTLPFELEAMTPFPIEDLLVDFTLISQTDQSAILSAAVKRKDISKHLELLIPHQVYPDTLDIKCMPIVSWLLKQNETPDNGLYLQLDEHISTMILFLNRRIELVRTFIYHETSKVKEPSGEANNDDIAPQAHKGPDSYFEELSTQVRNTLHFFISKSNKTTLPEKILFSGTWGIFPDSEEHLNRFLGIPAEKIDLSRNEKIHMDETITKWDPALMNNALALALRDTKHGQGFNFRKDEFEKKKHHFGPKKEIRKTAAALFILLCFLTANIGMGYHFLNKKHDKLNSKISALLKETLSVSRTPYGKEVAIMEMEINKIKKAASLSVNSGRDRVLDLIKDISQRIPDSLDVHLTRMVIDLESVRLSGNTDTFNTVDKIKNDLGSSKCFNSATISSAKLDRAGNKIEFEIKLERAG